MIYRENGQFKTSYRADQQILPIRQDRWAMLALLVLAFVVVPMTASDYMFRAVLLPFLIMSLAAVGVNVLVGYCGQISLGSGAFMAVGAYGAYNIFMRIPGMPLIPSLILDTLTLGRAPTPATSPDLLSRELQRAASDDLPPLIERLQSDPAGLSDAQAAAALAQHGPNEVEHEKPLPAWLHLWHCYKNPFNVLLTVLALISYLT